MLSVSEAKRRIKAGLKPMPAEIVPLSQALGRVLAQDVMARTSHPPVAVSSMDGYALLAASNLESLDTIGESAAGHGFSGEVGLGQAVRIFTGAPLPSGADAVVMQEDCERLSGNKVKVNRAAKPGQYIRPQGQDFKSGELLLKKGQLLTARDIGLLAAMNQVWLKVARKPKIAVLSTGDELSLPGELTNPCGLVSSNGFALCALIKATGGEAIDLGIAPDNQEGIRTLAQGAQGCDLLLVSGGASVGDYDLVKAALGDANFHLDFWKIAMRPGKPLMFGQMGEIPVLGLPGNPVAAIVCTVLFLVPALWQMQGLEKEHTLFPVILGADLPPNDEREDYIRARLGPQQIAIPFSKQDSGMLHTLAQADCLLIRPPFAPSAPKGESIMAINLNFGTMTV